MTMLITRFNRLIRNRYLWGALGFLIAFTFVGASVLSDAGCTDDAVVDTNREGILFGEPVMADTFRQARFFELGMRPMTDTSSEGMRRLRERTWRRLAALHAAEEMGLTVTDDEIREAIASDPTFTSNGAFDPNRYRHFVEQQLRVGAKTFEAYVRQDILLRKVGAALSACVWTPSYEMAPRLRQITDTLAVDYAIVEQAIDPETFAPQEDELQTWFAANTDQFRIDEQCRVRYVAFPVSNYLASVTVRDREISDYYERHDDQYTTVDTNDVEIVTPLDEVRAEIEALLRERKATYEAKDIATSFAATLATDRYGQALSFEDAATGRKLEILTSPWFTRNEPIPGIGGGLGVAETAFTLVAHDPDRYFSDAVVADDTVVVMVADGRRPARDAEFAEVRERVLDAWRREQAEAAFADKLAALSQTLQEAVEATNTTFVAAAEALGLTVESTGGFSAFEGMPESHAYGQALIPALLEARPGTVLDPIPIPAGAILATLTQRTPAAPEIREMIRPQLRRTLYQYRTQELFETWSDNLLARSDLEDFRPVDDTRDI